MGGSIFMSSKYNPLGLMGFEPFVAINSGGEGSVLSGSEVSFTPTRLVLSGWLVSNFSKEYFQSAVVVVDF